jgi:hypothetical protein
VSFQEILSPLSVEQNKQKAKDLGLKVENVVRSNHGTKSVNYAPVERKSLKKGQKRSSLQIVVLASSCPRPRPDRAVAAPTPGSSDIEMLFSMHAGSRLGSANARAAGGLLCGGGMSTFEQQHAVFLYTKI